MGKLSVLPVCTIRGFHLEKFREYADQIYRDPNRFFTRLEKEHGKEYARNQLKFWEELREGKNTIKLVIGFDKIWCVETGCYLRDDRKCKGREEEYAEMDRSKIEEACLEVGKVYTVSMQRKNARSSRYGFDVIFGSP